MSTEKKAATKVTTPEFRVAFPSVFRPRRNQLSGKDEYSLIALFKKGEDIDKLKKAAQEAAIKKWGQTGIPKKLKTPFKDQADRAKEDENGQEFLPDGYVAGAIYLNLKSNQRPGLVDRDMSEIIDEGDFYGGCWAHATINAYAYEAKNDQGVVVNRGVSFGLINLQKLRDDDPFGNRSKPEDDFKPVESADNGSGNANESASDLFS